MKSLVKGFRQFINESAEPKNNKIVIDLIAEYPEIHSREARIADEDTDDPFFHYTENIETTLTATKLYVSTDGEIEIQISKARRLFKLGLVSSRFFPGITERYPNIDPSFESIEYPVKVKLEFEDYENGYGGYGPHGGGRDGTIYCGLTEWSRSEVLNKYDKLFNAGAFD
jgi:hypothetical protein